MSTKRFYQLRISASSSTRESRRFISN